MILRDSVNVVECWGQELQSTWTQNNDAKTRFIPSGGERNGWYHERSVTAVYKTSLQVNI